jgi:transposase
MCLQWFNVPGHQVRALLHLTRGHIVSRRTFPAAYKVEVASKVLDDGMSVAQAGDTFGVGSTTVRRWVRQLDQERAGGVTKDTKPITPEQQRIHEIEPLHPAQRPPVRGGTQ